MKRFVFKKDYFYVFGAYACAIAAACIVVWRLGGIHPLLRVGLADGAATIVVFFFSRMLNNSSMYDLYWSVAPVPIALFLEFVTFAPVSPASALGISAQPLIAVRKAIVVLLVCVWAGRLSWNWARRWRGLKHEDWRYVRFRQKYRSSYWLVSLGGIHFFPTIIVLLGCMSLFPALTVPENPFYALHFFAAAVAFLAIFLEHISDRQLDRFLSRPDSPGGVLREGLWSVSRHPNYLGEILFWWGLWLFGLAANPAMVWTVIGPAAMTLMFLFISIPMIEKRLIVRRPAYGEYKHEVPVLLPRPGQALRAWRAILNRYLSE